MTLTFSTNHLGWIAQFVSDKQLFFKIKTAWLASNKTSITIPNLTVQEVISTYSQISSQSEGLAAQINAEIDDALMPQLLNAQGQPVSDEAAQILAWIADYKGSNAAQRQNQIDRSIEALNM